MKHVLRVVLAISVSINAFMFMANMDMHEALASESRSASAYRAILDQRDAEYAQREDIAHLISARNKHVPSIVVDQWASTVQTASQLYQVDPRILLSLFDIESTMVHYDSRGNITVSHKGAGGLGQIMPFWAKECPHSDRPSDLSNGSVNIMCTGYILRHYLDSNDNDMFFALTAYNSGPNGVRLMKRGRDVTQKYAARILWKYQETKTSFL